MSTELECVQPVLMTRDIRDSVRFFQRLGFHPTFEDDPAEPRYVVLRRDRVELHLQWHDAAQWAHPADRPTYRFVVQDVDGLYAEFRDRGAVPAHPTGPSPWETPGDTPWGTREFHVLDPDGNGLQFYRALRA